VLEECGNLTIDFNSCTDIALNVRGINEKIGFRLE
jgi:hypothetical protein